MKRKSESVAATRRDESRMFTARTSSVRWSSSKLSQFQFRGVLVDVEADDLFVGRTCLEYSMDPTNHPPQ